MDVYVRYGAYICVGASVDSFPLLAATPIDELAARLALENEFDAHSHPANAIAYLRRVETMGGQMPDVGVSDADAVVHVASNDPSVVSAACSEIDRLLSGRARIRVLAGRVTPTRYTGGAMHDFAYAGQRAQAAGASMPNAFLLPLRKTAEWWAKDWMERHTYLLPRYDANGHMVSEGHALAASAGIPALMRRTYRSSENSDYDFLTYFECADADVETFHAVCAALRDVQRNPEWRFVREGPTWRGRRLPRWSALWTAGLP
jgi:hypothetical protein